MSKSGSHSHELGIAAVGVAAGRLELVAEVLFAPPAEAACPARGVNPGNADPVAEPESPRSGTQGRDPSHHLMAQDDRQPRRRHPPLDLVELRVAHAACMYLDQQLIVGRDRIGKMVQLQRPRIVGQPTKGIAAPWHACRSTLAYVMIFPTFKLGMAALNRPEPTRPRATVGGDLNSNRTMFLAVP